MPIPANRDFKRLVSGIYRGFTELTTDFAAGKLTADEWGDAFHALLVDGHGDAWRLGSERGGRNTTNLQPLAQRYGQHYADLELEWFQNFINDMQDGRYLDDEGNLKESAVNARARLYAGKLRGTANQAFLDSKGMDESYNWVMTGIEHCQDCPRLAALSPYTASELFTVPGAGDTECLGMCRCLLVRLSDGVKGFNSPFA